MIQMNSSAQDSNEYLNISISLDRNFFASLANPAKARSDIFSDSDNFTILLVNKEADKCFGTVTLSLNIKETLEKNFQAKTNNFGDKSWFGEKNGDKLLETAEIENTSNSAKVIDFGVMDTSSIYCKDAQNAETQKNIIGTELSHYENVFETSLSDNFSGRNHFDADLLVRPNSISNEEVCKNASETYTQQNMSKLATELSKLFPVDDCLKDFISNFLTIPGDSIEKAPEIEHNIENNNILDAIKTSDSQMSFSKESQTEIGDNSNVLRNGDMVSSRVNEFARNRRSQFENGRNQCSAAVLSQSSANDNQNSEICRLLETKSNSSDNIYEAAETHTQGQTFSLQSETALNNHLRFSNPTSARVIGQGHIDMELGANFTVVPSDQDPIDNYRIALDACSSLLKKKTTQDINQNTNHQESSAANKSSNDFISSGSRIQSQKPRDLSRTKTFPGTIPGKRSTILRVNQNNPTQITETYVDRRGVNKKSMIRPKFNGAASRSLLSMELTKKPAAYTISGKFIIRHQNFKFYSKHFWLAHCLICNILVSNFSWKNNKTN